MPRDDPPETLDRTYRSRGQSQTDSTREPYREPQPEDEVWPPDWTPVQRSNWMQYAQPVYSALSTDAGRYWFRRCWRPKVALSGIMRHDYVEQGEPEMYVVTHVRELCKRHGDGTVNRKVIHTAAVQESPHDIETLNTAIRDIVSSRVQHWSAARRRTLPDKTLELLDDWLA